MPGKLIVIRGHPTALISSPEIVFAFDSLSPFSNICHCTTETLDGEHGILNISSGRR